MAQHVGRRLLDDPVAGGLDRGGQVGDRRGPHRDRDPRLAQPVGERLEVGQRGGGGERRAARRIAQHVQGAAQVAERVATGLLDRAQRGMGLGGVAIDQVRSDAGLHVDRGHRVSDGVMDLVRDRQPLGGHPLPCLRLARVRGAPGGDLAGAQQVAGGDREHAQHEALGDAEQQRVGRDRTARC